MAFIDFINKYYLPHQQKEINFILRDLCIYNEIESSLNDFYQATVGGNKIEIISQFALTSREFITTIYQPFFFIELGKREAIIKQKINKLINYLIYDTYQHSKLNTIEYFNLLKLTVRKTFDKNSWDFSLSENLLSADNTKLFAIDNIEKKNGHNFKLSKPIRLNWQGKQPLDIFIYDLTKTFPGIKSKKHLYYFFEEIEADFKIELKSKDLLTFLTLFYKLHNSRVIKVIGNRGLYVFLRQHLQAPANDRYPTRDFRKIRKDSEQNVQVNNNITKLIKPLLDKYCTS